MTTTPRAGRDVLLGSMKEAQFQRQVITWAKRAGWLVHHTHDSRYQEWGSDAGFPDLVLARRDSPLLLPELKTMTGRVSGAQLRWLAALNAATEVDAPTWRPNMDQQIKEALGLL